MKKVVSLQIIDIKRIIREHHEQLYANTIANVNKMNIFLEKPQVSKAHARG